MFLMPDKKKMAAIIVGSAEPEEKEEGYGESPEELKELASELIRAVKSGNASKVADVFKDMFLSCESREHEEYDED